MMKKKMIRIVLVAVYVAMAIIVKQSATAAEIPRMTKEELKAKLGTSDLLIVDIRVGTDWKASEMKIKGAVRGDPQNIETWAKKYPKDTTFVLYCA
jgi:rhodanese-related sulfurtransferase